MLTGILTDVGIWFTVIYIYSSQTFCEEIRAYNNNIIIYSIPAMMHVSYSKQLCMRSFNCMHYIVSSPPKFKVLAAIYIDSYKACMHSAEGKNLIDLRGLIIIARGNEYDVIVLIKKADCLCGHQSA